MNWDLFSLPLHWPIFWVLIGLSLGSFANVVIHRLPRNRSLFWPSSHCARCREPISPRDNLPVLGWLLLKGKSRCCGRSISCRYPLVEAMGGVLAFFLWRRWFGDWPWTAAALVFGTGLIAIAFIDAATFLIPDELSLGLWCLGTVLAPLNPLFSGSPSSKILAALLGGAFGFSLCLALLFAGKFLFKKDAMGGGDVKLLAAVGAWTGALGAYDCLVVASFLGAAYGGAQMAAQRLGRGDYVPFGPFLSAGALINLFYLIPFGFPFH